MYFSYIVGGQYIILWAMFGTIFLFLILSVGFFLILTMTVNYYFASKKYTGKINDHFDGNKFYNISWSAGETFRLTETEEEFFWKKHTNWLLTFYKWILNQKISLWKKRSVIQIQPKKNHEKKTTQVTYIGHATVLIQTHGFNLLTDPVWSKRASPVQWAWPKRYTDPGVALDDLPRIDAILLSHNHYDHMDIVTLRYLSERDHMSIYTWLGNKRYLNDRGIENVIEMDWWDSVELWETDDKNKDSQNKKTPKIIFLPSQHFSARGITDRNRTLWGGFVWEIGGTSGYFAGDTGYGPFVDSIKSRFPDGFDIGLLPIGAYNPRWFMAAMHTSPYEGMQMQRDLHIKTAIGIHYGTFPLAGDLQDEPIEDLIEAKQDPVFAGQDFRVGESGTSWEV